MASSAFTSLQRLQTQRVQPSTCSVKPAPCIRPVQRMDVKMFVDMGASDARKSQQEMAERFQNSQRNAGDLKETDVAPLPDSGKLQSKKADPNNQQQESQPMSEEKDSGEMAPGSDKFTKKEAQDALDEAMARSREAEDRQGPISMGGI